MESGARGRGARSCRQQETAGDCCSSVRPGRQSLGGNVALLRWLAFIPILRLDQFGAGGGRENDRICYGQRCSSSALRAAHVTPLRRSSSSKARRWSSSASCARIKGTSSCSRLSHSCAISARRSGGVNRPISSGVSNSMLSSLRNKTRAKQHQLRSYLNW